MNDSMVLKLTQRLHMASYALVKNASSIIEIHIACLHTLHAHDLKDWTKHKTSNVDIQTAVLLHICFCAVQTNDFDILQYWI